VLDIAAPTAAADNFGVVQNICRFTPFSDRHVLANYSRERSWRS